MGPFLKVGDDSDKPLTAFIEPVGDVARHYRLEFLALKAVARELDIEDPEQIIRQVGEKTLKRLGLDGLMHGGVVSRNAWEAIDGNRSLMQVLAKELRFDSDLQR